MKLLKEGGEGEIVEKKSRFIGTTFPVNTEEEAQEFIKAMKKKYYDARHNCWAYVIGDDNEITRSSDDGEPSGTAGRPMLDVLTHEGVHGIAVVVTRYFGGVLLGTGGLVRAYQAATKAALENSTISEMLTGRKLSFTCDYNDYGKISYYLDSQKIPTISSDFSDVVALEVFAVDGQSEVIRDEIFQMTSGKVTAEIGESMLLNA